MGDIVIMVCNKSSLDSQKRWKEKNKDKTSKYPNYYQENKEKINEKRKKERITKTQIINNHIKNAVHCHNSLFFIPDE